MDTPSVEITLREIYDTQIEMKDTLGRIADSIPDHEYRLRKLENRTQIWHGGLMVIAILVTPLLSLLAVRTWG